MRSFCLVLVLVSVMLSTAARTWSAEDTIQEDQKRPLVVFLLRHAEKVDDSTDPVLSDKGKQRAKQLARMFRDTTIDQIHSSNFKRTKSTASPLAELHEMEVAIYDPRKLEKFAETLKHAGGVHVVVGHSNTTPKLVELLGGEGGSEIEEASEYDRLYLVTVGADGTTQTILMRYGN